MCRCRVRHFPRRIVLEKVLLAMPTHDNRLHAGTSVAALSTPVGPDTSLAVETVSKPASLLAFNINTLWCFALNNRDKYRYFAMLHNDIVPENGWLDTLHSELTASGADIIGVAAPIKDGRGVTSCGIGYADEWRVPKKRFTLKELSELPQTFDSEQAGHPGEPMLLNTGCWLAELSSDKWLTAEEYRGTQALRIYFTITDRILLEDGLWAPRVQSEDWFFSLRLWEVGLRAVCTTAVGIEHIGDFGFSNRAVYGQEHDKVKVPE